MSRYLKLLALLLSAVLLTVACGSSGDSATPTPAPAVEAPAEAPTEAAPAPAEPIAVGDAVFFSTQFVPVEEQETFRRILAGGGFDVTGSEEGPLIDLVLAGRQAGQGTIDVIGALHGTYPPLARADAMGNLIDLAEDLSASRDFAQAFLETGLLGSNDFLYYVPWMQATYIMTAHTDAMPYLPTGADLNNLTWEQFGEW